MPPVNPAALKAMYQGAPSNPLYDGIPPQFQPPDSTPPPAQPQASSAPQQPAPQATPAPDTSSATPISQPGQISAAMSPPPSKQDYLSQNPVATPARPRGDFDKIPDGQPGADSWGNRHNVMRHALASLFAGAAEFGGDLNHHPGAAAPFIDRWQGQADAQRNYDQNQPVIKQAAENQQYGTALGQQAQATEIGKGQAEAGLTNAQTQNLLLNPPGKADFLKETQTRRKTGEDDPQQLAQEMLVRAPYSHTSRAEVMNVINNTPEQPPQAKIGPQGIAEPVKYHGRMWNGSEPDAPDVVKNAFQTAKPIEQTIHGNKLQEQQAARSNIVLGHDMTGEQQLTMEKQKQLDTIKKEAQESDESFNAITRLAQDKTGASDNALIDQYFNMAKPTSGARMNEAQMQRLQNFGPLTERIKQWGNEIVNGGRLTDQQHAEIVNAAKTLHDIKMEAVRNNQFVLGDQGASGQGQPQGQPQGQQGGGGHVIKLNNKRYQYNGSGDTADMKNYTELK